MNINRKMDVVHVLLYAENLAKSSLAEDLNLSEN